MLCTFPEVSHAIMDAYLLSGSQFLLQMLDGLFCHSDLPEGVFIRQLLALLPLPLLELSHAHPQLIHLKNPDEQGFRYIQMTVARWHTTQ